MSIVCNNMRRIHCFLVVLFGMTVFASTPVAYGKSIQASIRRSSRARKARKNDVLTPEQQEAFDKAYEYYSTADQHFQQVEPSFTDPVGDAALIWKIRRVPKKLLDALLGRAKGGDEGEVQEMESDEDTSVETESPATGGYDDLLFSEGETEESLSPVDELENREEQDYRVTSDGLIISKVKPLKISQLLNKCHEIMEKHYPKIVPFVGAPHRWCPAAIKYFDGDKPRHHHPKRPHQGSNGHGRPIFRTKLFACLACGWTTRYMITGQESALTEWILSQDDKSIQIHDLFETCYVLNEGDIYMALLTAENVLAGNPYRTDRQSDPVQKKLAYIRNDSIEKGDNYGSWYHFFGIALYASCRGPLTSRLVARIETLGSFFLEDPDPQENYMNNLGAVFGDKLERLVHEMTVHQEDTGEFLSLPQGADTKYRQHDPEFIRESVDE